jgi:hypothetical protein
MSFRILTVIAVAIILLTSIAVATITPSYGQEEALTTDHYIQDLVRSDPNKFTINENGVPIFKGLYTVVLKNETFASIDNDPKFADKEQVTTSNLPQVNAKVVPELLHEYTVETGKKVFEKVDQYNGTETSTLSPLSVQGGHVSDVYSHATRGFQVSGVEDISVFVGDPDVALVEPVPVEIPTTQFRSINNVRAGSSHVPIASGFRPDSVENFPNVDIAVLDSAVLRSHPDLNVAGSSTQCFVASGYSCYPPLSSHGTESAGNCCARDNLAGVVGSAPGARVWSVAICGTNPSGASTCGGGTVAAVTSYNNAINNLVNAGVVYLTGAGNDRTNADNKSFCNASHAICVSAMADMGDAKCGGLVASKTYRVGGNPTTYTQRDDARAFWSNFGSVVDLMAPGWGESSISTGVDLAGTADDPNVVNGAWPFIGASVHGTYAQQGGTSESTPWVAGAAAALKALHPEWTPAQIKSDLQTNGIAQNAPCDSSTGLGGLASGANTGSSEKLLNLAGID